MSKPDVFIVGAGLSGICCARKLHQQGISCRILEASDGIGGRVRTDRVGGFQLDRGFQVLLTAYPEALAELDYAQLDLGAFLPGALVRHEGRFYRMMDPWREPGSALLGLFSPVGTLADKFRIARLRHDVLRKSVDEILAGPESSSMRALRRRGFSHRMIERFCKPFFGGVMLDPKLATSSRMLEFVYRMFAEGDATLPARGMQAIPDQLAAALPEGSIELNRKVVSLSPGRLQLADGESLQARAVVVATEGPEAVRLLGHERAMASRSACCLYFAAKEPPIEEPILLISGSSRGPVNHLAVLNLVAPGYAPPDEFLISVSVLGWPSYDDDSLNRLVRTQLKRWYGLVVDEWRLLRIYRIEHGQPVVSPLEARRPVRLGAGLYVCGDHRSTPSIQGAMESGRLAAESLARELGGEPEPKPPERGKKETRLKETRGDSADPALL